MVVARQERQQQQHQTHVGIIHVTIHAMYFCTNKNKIGEKAERTLYTVIIKNSLLSSLTVFVNLPEFHLLELSGYFLLIGKSG